MPSLFHSLNIGSEALYATRQGVDTTGHNIANAQVEGFSRQRVNLTTRPPLERNGLIIGNGTFVKNITRSHDEFIEKQMNLTNQDAGRAKARASAMRQIEISFSPEMAANVGEELSKFFNAMQTLSNLPEDPTTRTSVVETAKNAAAAFRRVDADLKMHRASMNERVVEVCDRTTDNLKEIADLNIKIQAQEAGDPLTANDLRDQRDRLLREVSSNIEVHYYEDKNGMLVVRGPKEVTLVDAGNSAKVHAERNVNNNNFYDVLVTDWEDHSARNVTNGINGGTLDGLLKVRDDDLPNLIDKNNQMAQTFTETVNEIHRDGFGLGAYSEVTGRNFFREVFDPNLAAANIDVDDAIMESTDAIACASTPWAPGDNVNLNRILKTKDEKLFDGEQTFNEFYANYVGALGLDVVRADHIKEGCDILTEDLTKRREGVSGVSLDEEATNLLKWQTCFTANSKVITTIDEMLDTVLSLKR